MDEHKQSVAMANSRRGKIKECFIFGARYFNVMNVN